MLDLASQSAFVTGEWYIPGHKLRGFLIEELASMGGELSKGEENVEATGMVSGELGSTESGGIRGGFSVPEEKDLFWAVFVSGFPARKVGPFMSFGGF